MATSAPTQLATRNTNTNGQTSWAPSLGSSIPAGALCVLLFDSNAGYPTSVSDSGGNTWTIVQFSTRNSQNFTAAAYFYYSAAPGATTLTVSFPSTNMSFGWVGYVTGTSATPKDADGNAQAFGTSITPTTSTSLTDNDEIAFVVVGGSTNAAPSSWPTTNYNSLATLGDATRGYAAAMEYRIFSGGTGSGATESTTISFAGSRNMSAGIITFKPGGGGGGTTYTKAGTVTVDASNVSGADAVTASETGSVVSAGVTSGADVFTAAKTGAVISAGVTSCADASTINRSGTAVTAAVASGADVFTATETGAVVTAGVVSGADVGTFTETGSVISAGVLSGADAFTATETGAVISAGVLAGVSSTLASNTYTKAGVVVSAGVLAGPDVHEAVRTGAVISAFALSGPDAFTATRTGTVISEMALSGADVFTATETGAVVVAAALSGGVPSAVCWTYGGASTHTYSGDTTFSYGGAAGATYNGDAGFSYDGASTFTYSGCGGNA